MILFLEANPKSIKLDMFLFFSKIRIRIGNKKADRKSTGQIQLLLSINF